jgi:hypothetical protein
MDAVRSPDALPRHFRDGLIETLGANLIGIYLYGAITFPDSQDQIQDLDFHVIVRNEFSERERREVDSLCHDLARDFTVDRGDLDGYFITLEDTRQTVPPPTQMWPLWHTPADASWALHCAHIRAGQCIVLKGPDPLTLYPQPSWPDLRAALLVEIQFVDGHLADAPAYCVLNACRILYSFGSRNVVISKRGAADWAMEALAEEWHLVIRAGLRVYRGTATTEDEAAVQARVSDFVAHVWARIADGTE